MSAENIVRLECTDCEEESQYPVKAFGDEGDEPEVGDEAGAHSCDSCGNSIHVVVEVDA